MTRRKFRYDVYSGANKRSVHVYEGAKKKKRPKSTLNEFAPRINRQDLNPEDKNRWWKMHEDRLLIRIGANQVLRSRFQTHSGMIHGQCEPIQFSNPLRLERKNR